MNDLKTLFTSFEGRIPRSRLWLGTVIIIVASIILSFIIYPIFGVSLMSMGPTMIDPSMDAQTVMDEVAGISRRTGWAGLIVFLILLYPAAALIIKRRHDRGNSGIDFWIYSGLAALMLVLQATGISYTAMDTGGMAVPTPNVFGMVLGIVVFVFALYLVVVTGFLKGDSGDNAYGPDPLAKE